MLLEAEAPWYSFFFDFSKFFDCERSVNQTDCHAIKYPIYNEVLGRFAVLDRPNVIWTKRLGEDFFDNRIVRITASGNEIVTYDTTFACTPSRQDTFFLRFNGVLPYRFNPAANLNEQETELYAALQFKVPKIQDAANLVSPSVANNSAFKVFEDDTHILYQTRMMPLSCLAEFSAAVVYSFTGHTREWCQPITTEVGIESFGERTEARLKIVANFVFNGLNSFGAAPQALQIYTYKTDFYRERSQDYPILDYPNDIVFDNDIVFQNDTTIFAWNSVEIGASLSTANPNVQVEIIAPNIEMVLNSSVAPEISLFNKDFPVTCTPIQEYPDSLMAEFCSSNSYRANQSLARFVDNDTPPEDAQPAEMAKSPARLFPNPTRTQSTLRYELEAEAQVRISIVDVLGQERILMDAQQAAGTQELNINLRDYPAGLYYCRLMVDSEQQALPLRVQ